LLILWTLFLLGLLLAPIGNARVPTPRVIGFDKIAHFGLFFITAVLSMSGVGFSRLRDRIMFAVLFGLFLSAGTEFAQYFIPTRGTSIYDLLADVLGLALGIATCVVLRRRLLLMRSLPR
jgi:VanZ family protein